MVGSARADWVAEEDAHDSMAFIMLCSCPVTKESR